MTLRSSTVSLQKVSNCGSFHSSSNCTHPMQTINNNYSLRTTNTAKGSNAQSKVKQLGEGEPAREGVSKNVTSSFENQER